MCYHRVRREDEPSIIRMIGDPTRMAALPTLDECPRSKSQAIYVIVERT